MRGVPTLLLLLLLVPSSAATWSDGTLESLAVRDALLTGSGAVFQVKGSEEGTAPIMSLQGERVHVEAWWTKRDIDLQYATVTHTVETDQNNRTWHEASASILEARQEVLLFLDSDSETRVEDSRMSVGSHVQESVQETSTSMYHKETKVVNVPTLHEIGSSTGILWVMGNFTLSVYEWDLRVQNETASQDYWSGSRNTTGTLSPASNAREEQRLYLDVTNGTLRLPLTGLSVRDLFVAGTTLRAASAVLDLAGRDTPLSLAGPLHFGLGPVEDGSFQGSVLPPDQGLTEAPVVRPDPVAPADHSTSAVGEEGIWTTSLLILVLAVAAAVLVGWRALRLLRLRRAMSDGDYRSVAAGAGLENSRRFGAEVVVARVVSMVKTGEYAAAAGLLEKRGVQLTPGVRAYLWACVHAGTGAIDEARDAVIESLVSDPGMAAEVAANGSLRRFLADVEEGAYS